MSKDGASVVELGSSRGNSKKKPSRELKGKQYSKKEKGEKKEATKEKREKKEAKKQPKKQSKGSTSKQAQAATKVANTAARVNSPKPTVKPPKKGFGSFAMDMRDKVTDPMRKPKGREGRKITEILQKMLSSAGMKGKPLLGHLCIGSTQIKGTRTYNPKDTKTTDHCKNADVLYTVQTHRLGANANTLKETRELRNWASMKFGAAFKREPEKVLRTFFKH